MIHKKINTMTISDYDEVYGLWTKTSGIGLRSLDDSKEGIDKFLKRNPETNFVYRINDDIVGVILCGHDGRRGYIYHAAVDSSFRNQGIGKQLLDSVISSLEKEGIKKVALVAYIKNTVGNEFWKSSGFVNREDLTYRDKSIDSLN
nr:N-acetyltransferase [Spirochaetaceae bacterium]